MANTTEHVARKARRCDEYPRCRHGIERGQRYRRWVGFPREEGMEEAKGPRALTTCAGCAAASHRPITGARVEAFVLDRDEPVVFAAGVITETRYRHGSVVGYVITDEHGSQHDASHHRVIVLEAVATAPKPTEAGEGR